MRVLIAGWVLGTLLLQCQPELPSAFILSMLAMLAVLLGGLSRRAALHKCAIMLRLSAGVLAGIVWAALLAHHALQQTLPKTWEGRDVTLVGRIDSLPTPFERGIRFQFAVEEAHENGQPVAGIPSRIALSWYGGFDAARSSAVPVLQPGERWQLTVRLKRPHGTANPYGFDYEAWLLEQGVRATGYVRPDDKRLHKNLRRDPFVYGVGSVIDRMRSGLRDRILAALPEKAYAGILVALVIGEQRAISSSDWTLFTRTGVSHLISISGLHITMIAGMAAFVSAALWRRSFFTRRQLPLRVPAQKVAALVGACVALLYVLLAGFGVPAQRTFYMLSVVALALWFDRLTSVSHVLCLALGVVVVLDPWAVWWPGFWLSFGAVGVILYVSVGRAAQFAEPPRARLARWMELCKRAVRTQYAVTLGLVPLTLLLFGQISVISPLANAVAIPVISMIVTPLALIGSVLPMPMSGWVLTVAHACLSGLVHGLGWLSEFFFAVWMAPVSSLGIFLLALLGTGWMLAPRGWPVRWLGGVCCLPLFFGASTHPAAGEAWVTVFDVGQGSAVLIETQQHRLLYDTGPMYGPESDGGNRVLIPYLRGRGIRTLDTLIVTHEDADHAGGMRSIASAVSVDAVLTSLSADDPMLQESLPRTIPYRRCEAGQQWVWDGVRFDMLYPTPEQYARTNGKPNDRSCVLKVTVGQNAVLLTGDIGKSQERELVKVYGEQLRSAVLLAPHHGGAASSSQIFLETVQPEMALFQVGYRNRFHHPRPDVLARYQDLGIQSFRTDYSGAVTIRFGKTRTLEEYRKTAARYWWQ